MRRRKQTKTRKVNVRKKWENLEEEEKRHHKKKEETRREVLRK
jgi:hypothetical protein